MSLSCTHPECQIYDSCRHQQSMTVQVDDTLVNAPVFNVKSWLDAAYSADPGKAMESPDSQPQQVDSDVIEKIPESADQDAALDTLVSRASIPNLGALIKQGVKQGLIAPTTSYR